MDQEQNPVVQKILDFAKGKTVISWDEITDLVVRTLLILQRWKKFFQFFQNTMFR